MFESIRGESPVFNTAVVVDGGGVIASYRKRHLFDALGELESARIRAGEEGFIEGAGVEDQWTVLARAWAMDNTMQVAAAGQTGSHYSGSSSIADPPGVIVARLGEAPGVESAEISRERLETVRRCLPPLGQRNCRRAASVSR